MMNNLVIRDGWRCCWKMLLRCCSMAMYYTKLRGVSCTKLYIERFTLVLIVFFCFHVAVSESSM